MQQAGDDLQDFLARSPGERGAVLSSKGKGKGAALAFDPGKAAEDEVLGKVFDIPSETPEDDIAGLVPAEKVPEVALASGPPNVLVPGGFVPSSNTPPGGGIGTPPGGGGPGGTPPGSGNPPVGGVPEPSTWALMIFGFMFAGGAMRRRNRLERVGSFA